MLKSKRVGLLGWIVFSVAGMSMGWVPDQVPSNPTPQNERVSSLADQTLQHLQFKPEDAARYHDRLMQGLSWGQAKGFFPRLSI